MITLPSSTMNMTGLLRLEARVELRERFGSPRSTRSRERPAAASAIMTSEASRARLSSSTLTPGSPKKPRLRPSVAALTNFRTVASGTCRTAAIRRDCNLALAGVMSGSMPEPGGDGVDGNIAAVNPGLYGRSSLRIAAAAAATFFARSGFVGPRLANVVARVVGGRGRRGSRMEVLAPVKPCAASREPTTRRCG